MQPESIRMQIPTTNKLMTKFDYNIRNNSFIVIDTHSSPTTTTIIVY